MSALSLPGKEGEPGFVDTPPSALGVTVPTWHSQADHAPCVQTSRPGVEPYVHGAVTFSGAQAAMVEGVPPVPPGIPSFGGASALDAEHARERWSGTSMKPQTDNSRDKAMGSLPLVQLARP